MKKSINFCNMTTAQLCGRI